MTKSGKHCGKRRNCTLCAISSFVTYVFKKPSAAEASKSVYMRERVNDWLSKLQDKRFLPANYGNKFDFPILINQMQESKLLVSLSNLITGVVDTFPIIQQNISLPDYKLSTIYSHLCNDIEDSFHNADKDVIALQRICTDCNSGLLTKLCGKYCQ